MRIFRSRGIDPTAACVALAISAGCEVWAPPAPTRSGRAEETVRRKFLRLDVNTLVACDFFTKRVITPLGVLPCLHPCGPAEGLPQPANVLPERQVDSAARSQCPDVGGRAAAWGEVYPPRPRLEVLNRLPRTLPWRGHTAVVNTAAGTRCERLCFMVHLIGRVSTELRGLLFFR